MQARIKKFYLIGLFALLLAFVIAFNPFTVGASHAAATWPGRTIDWSNVRAGPGTSYGAVTVYAPNTAVTVYATVSGQIVWGGISNWYRITNFSSAARYIYGALVVQSNPTTGGQHGPTPQPSPQGKEIVVSLSHQWMWAYQNGKLLYNSAVMTGRPALATPTGTYHVFLKLHPTTFYSSWPPGSLYWYPPTFINYALEWRAGGFFLHDTWWHTVYGPGTNGWHYDPKYGWQWGTHGCVAMPLSAAAWLYNWAPIGTTVQINP